MQTLKVIFFGLVAYALFEIFAYEILHYGSEMQALGYRLGQQDAKELCRTAHQDILWNQVSDKDKYEMWHTARRVK